MGCRGRLGPAGALQEGQLGYQEWATRFGGEQEAARQAEQLAYARWATGGAWGQETGMQERQLAYEKWATGGGWEQQTAMQQRGIEAEAGLQTERLASQEMQANVAAFGRRWRPNTRWL